MLARVNREAYLRHLVKYDHDSIRNIEGNGICIAQVWENSSTLASLAIYTDDKGKPVEYFISTIYVNEEDRRL